MKQGFWDAGPASMDEMIVTFPTADGRFRWHLLQGETVLAAGRRGWWTEEEAEADAARAQIAMSMAQFA